MNNIKIAILLNDIFLTRVFTEISKDHKDQFKFEIINNDEDIPDYNVFITDVINLHKIKDNLNINYKILCIGEKSDFKNFSNKNYEISFLKIPFKFSELKERAENLISLLKSEKSKIIKFKDFECK